MSTSTQRSRSRIRIARNKDPDDNDSSNSSPKQRELLYCFLAFIGCACVLRAITGISQTQLPMAITNGRDANATSNSARNSHMINSTAMAISRVALPHRFRVEEEDILMQEVEEQHSKSSLPTPAKKYGVGSYVDEREHVYGVYSVRTQLRKFNMTNANNTDQETGITQFVVVSNRLQPELMLLLEEWLGPDHVHAVDRDIIVRALNGDSGQWKGPYCKLFLFNQTQYDKVIVFDGDILVRQDVRHWFNFPTPCAIQTKDDVAHNSGAMIISPSKTVFDDMMSKLPTLKRWKLNPEIDPNIDTGTGMYGDQDFLSAYFANRTRAQDRFHTMPTESAALSSSLYSPLWEYYLRFRPHIFETIHFTTDKPYRVKGSTNQYVCKFLREWFDSIKDLKEYESLPLLKPEEHLQGCPPPPNTTSIAVETGVATNTGSTTNQSDDEKLSEKNRHVV